MSLRKVRSLSKLTWELVSGSLGSPSGSVSEVLCVSLNHVATDQRQQAPVASLPRPCQCDLLIREEYPVVRPAARHNGNNNNKKPKSDVMYDRVIMVNNTVLCVWKLLRE